MYHAGAPIESISKILGHEDIVTTLKYLGINLDDMQAAMDLHGDYQKKIRMEMFQKGGCPECPFSAQWSYHSA
jgi:hypothetical protein